MPTSLIVPVYNGAHVLRATVPAVLAQQGVDEWLWVDDGSTDGTPAVLNDLLEGHQKARAVQLNRNAGRSAARNRGLQETSGNDVVFFDADVRPPPDAAARLSARAREADAVAAVGRVLPVVDQPRDPFQVYLSRHPRGPSRGATSGPIPWKYFLTGLCAVRRSSLDAAGGFDESIEYGEDLALACRLRESHPDGLRLVEVDIDLLDLGTIDRALRNVEAVGRALPRLVADCPDLLQVAGVDRAAASQILMRLARIPLPVDSFGRVLRRAPPVVAARAVRYLLGFTLLSAFAGARDRSS